MNVKNGFGRQVPLNNSTRMRTIGARGVPASLPEKGRATASPSLGLRVVQPWHREMHSYQAVLGANLFPDALPACPNLFRDRGVFVPLGDWRWPLIGSLANEITGRAK